MLFDIRGRRKHVIRVVYAILALLMGASLFLVVGPFNIANLIGGSATSETAKVLVEQAERAEEKLTREPQNQTVLLTVARTRVAAGNAQAETNPQTGQPVLTPEALESYEKATAAWDAYLKQAESPSPAGASLMAGAFFTLAENVGEIEPIDEAIEGAARAQRIAAEAQPSVGTLSTLAIYEFFNGNFAAGEKAGKEAQAKASGAQAKEVKKQMAEYRKAGESWITQKKSYAKTEKERGKESLENPFGGLGSGAGG
ncbi:MAG TPA: hypothetical protein VF245_07990 [Solirubrobacterales bacterium]